MKVAFTLSDVVDVPEHPRGARKEDFRERILEAITKKLVTNAPGVLTTITKTVEKNVDEILVEYDVIEDESLCSCTTSHGSKCCRKCPEEKIHGITGCVSCSNAYKSP